MFFILILIVLILKSSNAEDYCIHEYFTPECKHDEVVVMEKATYGRMNTGKCLKIHDDSPSKKDGMYFGCESNVMEFMDGQCSGHQRCNVQVAHPELIRQTTCHQDLMHYLKAEYSCLPVVTNDRSCTVWTTGKTNLLISNKPHDDKEVCGRPSNPWIIETPEGQNVDLSLMRFTMKRNYSNNQSVEKCQNLNNSNKSTTLGKIIEPNMDSIVKYLCIDEQRKMHKYISKGNKIKVVITQNIETRFILVIEATGCYDLKPPQDAWMKREGSEITVGCYMNRHTWKLVCNGRNWVGVIGNCTQLSQDVLRELNEDLPPKLAGNSIKKKTVFILIVGMTLIILISLAMICSLMIFCQRSKLARKYQGSSMYDGNINQPFNTTINGDLKFLREKETNGKLESSNQDPGYYVLENDDGNKEKN